MHDSMQSADGFESFHRVSESRLRHALVARYGPGGLYSAGIGEPHERVALTEMTLACVFTPPLEGSEEAV